MQKNQNKEEKNKKKIINYKKKDFIKHCFAERIFWFGVFSFLFYFLFLEDPQNKQ